MFAGALLDKAMDGKSVVFVKDGFCFEGPEIQEDTVPHKAMNRSQRQLTAVM